uniref:TPS65 n=1 Tax=Juglans sigillata TaxID=224355 RepID=A0A8K1B1I3_9ROSI|nr:TPS65 [Juglans sigillata]
MAASMFTKTFFASINPPTAPNRIQKTANSNPFSLTSLPTAHKHWKNSQDHDDTFTSTPLEYPNYGTKKHDFGGLSVQHSHKLEACRRALRKVGKDDGFESLNMINAIQRLGIDYHFEEDIDAILKEQYAKYIALGDCGQNLHEVALRFRLLRQRGYYVPADVFNNFKNREGKFDKELDNDINGLMSLFEASQLSIEGEGTLDEARSFCEQLLNAWQIRHPDDNQVSVVGNTLGNPYHKSLARFMAKKFFDNLNGTNGLWLNDLHQLAKMDFNMVQSIHQKEIVQMSIWWKDVGLAQELKFARDQPLKWYVVSMACLTDPDLSEERVDLTKPISLIYIIDDIFDVHGTLEEVTLFTEAINKWDLAAVEELPEYMKICLKALNDITDEISHKIYQKHGWNPVDSLRKTWASLCNAFLVEAPWFSSGQSPKAEEYLKNAVVSSGVHVVLVHIFFLLGHGATKETVHLVDNVPEIISSPATILRLWDDLGSAMDESQDGHDGSYIDYYMKEHKDYAVKEVREKVVDMISDSWKRLNKECLISPNPLPAKFNEACLNMARMVPLLYSYDDNHDLPSLEEHMKSVLDQSVPM